MRSRLSLHTWVESTPTVFERGQNDRRQNLTCMASLRVQDTLCRNGYDEEKCRNVLVRYCAHIPRNYQYCDGVQLVFLILREHLGDENLDLAGGVLYELIEIDCHHSDDPGAEFQRWKHDHLNRHSNFELPHIPHMSTITTSVRPTLSLIQWRQNHTNRYPTRLSDHHLTLRTSSNEPSCVRSRKAWMIDHTMYVSTREGGTCAFRSPNPKEMHEMQWDIGVGQVGRFLKEEVVPIASSAQSAGPSTHNDIVDTNVSQSRALKIGKSGALRIFRRPVALKTPSFERRSSATRHCSLFADTLDLNAILSSQDSADHEPVPLPNGCISPHAIFARKFSLISDSVPLPPSLSHKLMPTADIKAKKLLIEAAEKGLMGPS
ncbi:uncharacterized protein CTRU02_203589 [Colletotrichum truncatum]|uniref:Uncharacterized protein n=1 Tax=Colletotrichum truncatum TaxID=5467 RepID=A0ACC3Z9T3_COLTU|nr:uncharacterized protein CTRU02_03923 [Colletotrichum truncatum]KAF6795963.1 hypothetical protein CTRU02_03923 [Colletotrichum truncatum]